MVWLFPLVYVLLAAWLWPASLDTSRTYRVIYSQNPPYYQLAPGATRPHGAMIELFDEAARRRGLRLEWVLSGDAPESLLRSNQADLLMLAVLTPERLQEFHLTEPWLRVEAQLLWRRRDDSPATPDLRGKRLGVPGYRLYETTAAQVFPQSRIFRHSSRSHLLEMVCRGELDATLVDARSATMLLLDRGPVCAGVRLGMNTIDTGLSDIGIMAARHSAPAAEALRDEITRLSADGGMRRIYEQWGVGFLPEVRAIEAIQRERQKSRTLTALLILASCLVFAIAVLAFVLRRARLRADQASRAKSAFLATISHETRTPLNGIIGLAEALAEDCADPRQQSVAHTIAQCGRNLVSLVSDVLDHSKLEAGRITPQQTVFALAQSLQPVVDSLAAVAHQRNLGFHVALHPDLPAWVSGDPLRLAQVLFNLLGNATKFTDSGSIALTVDPVPDGIRFAVSDTGIGLTPLEQTRLFEAFWQADQGPARRANGSGLGLSISRRLVQAMGGEILVESTPGRGSTFSFTLPLAPAVPAPLTTSQDPEPIASLRILFAEDNLVNQKVVIRLLEKMGHFVTTVPNGAEAVAQFQQESFDVVLLDCHMPVEDGFSAARRIRAIEAGSSRRIPIIALTALAFPEDRAQCLAAGMDEHITKPVSRQALAAVLSRLLLPSLR